MKNGVCPRCGKADVRRLDARWYGQRALVLSFWNRPPALTLTTYLCAACGYVEEYVSPADLPRVAASNLERVDRRDRDADLDADLTRR
jgi:hypothetical protein